MEGETYDFVCRSTIKPKKENLRKKKWAALSISNSQGNTSTHPVNITMKNRINVTKEDFTKRNDNKNLEELPEEPLDDFFKDSFTTTTTQSVQAQPIDYFKMICIDNGTINYATEKHANKKSTIRTNGVQDNPKPITGDLLNTFNSPSLFSSESGGSCNTPSSVLSRLKPLSGQAFENTNSFASGKKADLEISQTSKPSKVIPHLEDEKENLATTFKFPTSKKRSIPEEKKSKLKVFKCEKPVPSQKPNINESLWCNDSSQMFKSSQYRKEVSQLFENLEQSVCQMGPNDNNNTEVTNWPEESFSLETVINGFTQENSAGTSIGDLVKKSLLENATKSIEPSNLVNKTVISNAVSFNELGPFYGLPKKVNELIQLYKGIDKLYDWQDECLKLPAVTQRKNLIYSLPTSGGKTLVAEILIFREIICRKRNVIFVLPYVAIVQEKVWALSPFGVALDFLIEEYAAGKGTCPPRKRRYKNSVYIATTEKALSLINSLVENGRIEEIGLVVVDELHLIGEDKRGAKLETLLTKLMFLNEDIQIVGMSATIGNLEDICRFLDAELYTRNFRPVELLEYVKCGNQIAKVNCSKKDEDIFGPLKTVNFHYSESMVKIDPDHLGGLVLEVIPAGSCLIFCSTKKSCENVTSLLCKTLPLKLKMHKQQEKMQLIKALKNEAETLCSILKVSVPFGIAYHHSGLTSEERKLIEESYRAGILSVICCTSTLAAGVNLPAKRVIIRKPYIAQNFINLSRYKQMVGRAGRAGLGELGESILICQQNELPRVREMFALPMDQTLSQMHDSNGIHLRDLFLSCISLRTATTKSQLQELTTNTLLSVQQNKLGVDLKSLSKKALSDLLVLGAVEISNNSEMIPADSQSLNISVYSNISETSGNSRKSKKRIVVSNETKLCITKLGAAAIKGGLDMCSALTLYEDLLQAQESLVLIDCLHLLYLVTPYNLGEQIRPSKNEYHHVMLQIGEKERKTAAVLGISESCIVRILSNQTVKNVSERVLNRFYMSLMLYDLWNETPVIDVSEKYQVSRGIVQNMMTAASTFAANVVGFCEELEEFWSFAHLLKGMCQRLSHCCTKELVPLMELPAVKLCRAKQLYNAGYKTLQSIAKADETELTASIEFMSRRLASQLIAAAKLLLLQKIETLREEAEDVLDGVENPSEIFKKPTAK